MPVDGNPFKKLTDPPAGAPKPPTNGTSAPRASQAKGKKLIELMPLPKLRQQLVDVHMTVAMGLMGPLPSSGFTLMADAERIADALIEACKSSPYLHRMLSGTAQGAVLFSVLAAYSGTAMSISAELKIPKDQRIERAMGVQAARAESQQTPAGATV